MNPIFTDQSAKPKQPRPRLTRQQRCKVRKGTAGQHSSSAGDEVYKEEPRAVRACTDPGSVFASLNGTDVI